MKIVTSEILEAHQRLSSADVHFLEFIQANPGALKCGNYNDLVTHALDCPRLQPWPTFINGALKKQLQEAGVGVFHLIRQIPGRIFGNDPKKISSYFDFPEDYTLIQMECSQDGHLENLLGRGDFILSASGLKCMEYNASINLGGWQLALMEPVYLKNPIIAKFLDDYQVKTCNENLVAILLRHLFNGAVQKFPPPHYREINLAFVIPQFEKSKDYQTIEDYFNGVYRQVLEDHDYHGKGTVLFCNPSGLTIDDYCIFYNGKRIHITAESYQGDVPFEICFASMMDNTILYNGPITSLLSDKLNLALLSENEDTGVFTPGEREIIKTYIPWTRRIVPTNITYGKETFPTGNFLVSRREELVLKPARGLGGEDVHIGKYTPTDQWEKIVQQALRDESSLWIAQEYVESLPHLYQYGDDGCAVHETVWGLFVFGQQYAGGFLRVSPKNGNTGGIINTTQGAAETVILEVDE